MTNEITLHQARREDAAEVAAMLSALRDAGLRTRPCDEDFVREVYIVNPIGVRTTVARIDGAIVGIQILSRAEAGNQFGAPEGWGIIGTHVAQDVARGGIGRALFDVTQAAARQAGLPGIEAFIGADNVMGLGYYGAMGFETVREEKGAIIKAWLPR